MSKIMKMGPGGIGDEPKSHPGLGQGKKVC